MAHIRFHLLLVILFLIFLVSYSSSQWDEDYELAYKFIYTDTLNINNMLKEYMEYENFPKILMSNERVYFSRV